MCLSISYIILTRIEISYIVSCHSDSDGNGKIHQNLQSLLITTSGKPKSSNKTTVSPHFLWVSGKTTCWSSTTGLICCWNNVKQLQQVVNDGLYWYFPFMWPIDCQVYKMALSPFYRGYRDLQENKTGYKHKTYCIILPPAFHNIQISQKHSICSASFPPNISFISKYL